MAQNRSLSVDLKKAFTNLLIRYEWSNSINFIDIE